MSHVRLKFFEIAYCEFVEIADFYFYIMIKSMNSYQIIKRIYLYVIHFFLLYECVIFKYFNYTFFVYRLFLSTNNIFL